MIVAAAPRVMPVGAPGLAFLGVVLLGGVNAVAVRIADGELAPLWGATLRFGIAAGVLLVIVALTRTPLPRGRALTGSVLYGAIGFAAAFGCIHWALARVPPASAQTILALVPLLTFLFAVTQGLERFRAASLVGALVAFAGIAVIFGERLGTATGLPGATRGRGRSGVHGRVEHHRQALSQVPPRRQQCGRDDGRRRPPAGGLVRDWRARGSCRPTRGPGVPWPMCRWQVPRPSSHCSCTWCSAGPRRRRVA